MPDPVNHPDHYTFRSKEFLDILVDLLTEEQLEGFFIANIYKYIFRAEKKNGVEDLLKAEFYLKRLIKLKKGVDPIDLKQS